MADPRVSQLAETLIDHSCQLQAGEQVLIEAFDLLDPAVVCRLIELAAERNAHPFVNWKNNQVLRTLYRTGSEVNIKLAGQLERAQMEHMDAYIGIRGAANSSEFVDVPHAQMDLYQKLWWHPVHSEVRVPKTRWVVLRYPTPSMAQAADMSCEAFEDFYFDVCTADYAQMAADQQPLVARMDAADEVRVVGPDTDLTFSIQGIPARPCHGQRNIPDGEVFTAPVRDSVNGTIRYNTRSRYQGTIFEDIRFTFDSGKIVKATANETDKLNQILDADEGARCIGEWSLGCNNRVLHPMLDTLFDEKIGGSMHLTPGQAYDEADNGNRSVVHWDLVLIQRPDYGGGELYFDRELIRKDGRFVPDDLQGLNAGLPLNAMGELNDAQQTVSQLQGKVILMRTILCAAICWTCLTLAAPAAESESFVDQEGQHLDIMRDGKPLVRYMYAFDDSTPESLHNTYKTYHHVLAPDGKQLITKGPGGKYTHHRGIFIGFSKLGHAGKRYDHWHMKKVNMVHQRFVKQTADDRSAAVTSVIHWNDPAGAPILEETRTLTAHFTDADAHLLADFETRLKAVNGDVELRGDPEHAGMQYRPHNDVAQNKSAKYTFHAGGINPRKDRDLPWVALTYQLGDQTYTVQHMRHPDDPSDSVYSAYRDYGRFGNYFVATIPDGETLTLRYRLRITLGDVPARDVLADQYEQYVAQ